MFPGQCGNTAFFFKSQPDQFHFEFRGIVFPGKSFFSAHEVSTCKISGCLSYRILDSGPDGTQTTLTSYQMLPGYFRFVCQNGCVCGQSLGEVRVPHRGNVVDRVIEGAYEVVGVFDRIEEKRDAMQSLVLPPPARQALAQAALTYRYGDEHQPVTTADILTPRRREDYGKDLWSAYQTIQENMLKGGISGRSARGKRIHTRAIHSIDTDIKLNRALWVMAETLLESLR
nr:DUF932 domain-containing protein [Escherichia coli]